MTATKDQLRKELEARRRIGAMMANFCFNRAQDDRLPKRDRDTMNQMRIDWDTIPRADIEAAKRARKPWPTSSHQTT